MSSHKAYLTGASLWCNLGKTPNEITRTVHSLNAHNYEIFLQEHFAQKPYYHLLESFESEEKKLYTCIDYVVKKAIEAAKLDKEEQAELAIFIGSTAMGISLNEESYTRYVLSKEGKAFEHIGYGYLGEYLETLTHSKHKALLFSTACTSSVNALAYASKMIEQGVISKALVLGIELFNQTTYNGFSSLMLLSKSNIYRPFDEKSDGIILGEGCSALILENQPKHTDDFYYKSSKNICDIYSETTSDPSGEPIFETMDGALKAAHLHLHDINLIKAHATGSENNNTSEANALNLLFEKYKTHAPVTALKPFIGHTLGASGCNEIALMLLCAKKGFLPHTLGFEKGTKETSFTPMREPFTCKDKPLSILFNFVAFGGNTTSLILARD
ncbi:beta-ketoacyl synthase N-terminal-like domain-containing protein [Sulfurospirillum barnesii]|uniref:3-oxoacyl-(Acyl-carrier-protein) synthase n=1 Tax=Sulfurospirillum barnesii (strain ATCC 700032 / DSM 10660 / SES-3) TaxID=760154 RepID=I3Y002_SULBS|nr:beta-ketoacyl synthase N-terminal-like domain-containing protein [Sulfurospirillum barnesii]AFL69526.1 3-oxoacyl-(acyl-carrier-protein) synthase [Sulfurospirillum barnesii SES-3]